MYKSTIAISELRPLPTLEKLSEDGLNRLASNMEELRLAKGQSVYRPGQSARYLYCVLEGTIGVSLPCSEGRFVRLTLSARGEFFGIDALIQGWRRVGMATAVQSSRVARLEPRVFVTEVCGVPWEPFNGLIDTLIKPVLKVSLLRAMFLVGDLFDKVALALWENTSSFGHKLANGLSAGVLTHDELAAMVGASRPRVSLALKQLERRGFLVRRRKEMRVQEKALRAYLEERYGFVL